MADTESKKAVGSMSKQQRPSNCAGRKSCETVCPKRIRIIEMMKEFGKMIAM